MFDLTEKVAFVAGGAGYLALPACGTFRYRLEKFQFACCSGYAGGGGAAYDCVACAGAYTVGGMFALAIIANFCCNCAT